MTYVTIPDEKLKPGMKVHVKGWNKGCVFVYQKTEGGRHVLKTPKTQKIYFTTNQLQYIRANEPAPDLSKWKGRCRFHGTSNKYCCGNWTETKKVESVSGA